MNYLGNGNSNPDVGFCQDMQCFWHLPTQAAASKVCLEALGCCIFAISV